MYLLIITKWQAPVNLKRPLFFLLDYMFRNLGRSCTDFFLRSIPSLTSSFYQSVGNHEHDCINLQANSDMRRKLAEIVGMWARDRILPPNVIKDIHVVYCSNCLNNRDSLPNWKINKYSTRIGWLSSTMH